MVPVVRGFCGGSACHSRSTCNNVLQHHNLGIKPWPTQLLIMPSHHQQQQSQRSSYVTAAATRGAQAEDPPKRARRTAGGKQQPSQISADAGFDDMFLDPQAAAKLRRLMKEKGADAVVDSKGIVKVPITEEDSTADSDTTQPRSSRRHNTTADSEPDSDSSSSEQEQHQQQEQVQRPSSTNGSSSRGKLFSRSQLKPAAPGSGGTAPVLPIVRPSSEDESSGYSSRSSRQADVPPWIRKSRRPDTSFFSDKSWQDLRAMPELTEALKNLGITKPSHVQAESFKALSPKSGYKHVAIADQAGSGKTLAYLLPLLQQLKQKEVKLGGPATQANSPSIIIMAPTTELVQQVGRVIRALSAAGIRVRSAVMTGGQAEADRRSKTFRTQCELLDGGVDVLVATPGRLLSHLEKGSLKLDNTAALVMDEVDVLAGGEVSYSEHIAPLRAAGGPDMRCVLVSATLPQHTFDELQELFMGLGAAFGPGLHRTATGCIEELVDCSGGDDISLESGTQLKLDALMEALDRVKSPRTLVFCNKIETCRVVENALKRRLPGSCEVLAYHEAIREETRAANLTSWLSPPSPSKPSMVLVCTDRTSRGIDSMWCEHVVLFEFPRDPSEYVRRVGRTARGAGGKGVVTVLVLGKQVALAKDILARNKAGAPVHRVPRLWNDTA